MTLATDWTEFRRSWHILLATALLTCFTWVPIVTFSLFIEPMQRDLGWSSAAIGGWVTWFFIGATLVLPPVGHLADRIGARRVVLLFLPCFAAAIAAVGIVPRSIWALHGLGALAGVFSSAVCNGAGPSLRPLVAAFSARRGLALSITTAAASAATFLGPSCLQPLIDGYSWRVGYFFLALISIAAFPFLIAWFHEPIASNPATRVSPVSPAARRYALRHPVFWLLCAAAFISMCGVFGLVIFLAPFLTSHGIDRVNAAAIIGAFGVASVVGKLASGALCDRFHAALISSAALLIQSAALAALAFFPTMGGVALLCLAVGLTSGVESPTFPYLIARYFDMKIFAMLVGIISVMGALGYAASPYLFGRLHDISVSYTLPLTTSAIMAFISSGLFAALYRFGLTSKIGTYSPDVSHIQSPVRT